MAVQAEPNKLAAAPPPPVENENTPLLNNSHNTNGKAAKILGSLKGQADNSSASSATPLPREPEDDDKPFPFWQILILCYASVVEPMAFFSIFPYINQMVERIGDQLPENVGFWTGTIESLFSLVQMVLIMFYGRVADRWGRKPVLVFSLAGVALASSLFGMSSSLWQMILFRCLAGFFAGSSVTIRSMLSENCTKYTQARAFGWFMFARQLGILFGPAIGMSCLFGPAIGGALANPAEQYQAFRDVPLFRDHAYALPGFVSGAFCLSTAIVSTVFLNETLPSHLPKKGKTRYDMSTKELLKAPGVAPVLFIFSHVTLQALAYTAVNPVTQYTPIHLGGYSFSPKQISLVLALAGASQALWMLLAFPFLQIRTSTGTVLRGCCIAWPIMMACYPLLNELLRAGLYAAFWTLGAACLVLGSGVAMSFACVQLCLNDIAPSPSTLATLNAVALTVTSGVRAVAPVAANSLYAAGIKSGWLHGQLGWIFLVLLALTLNVSVRWLPEKAEGRVHRQVEREDGDES